MVNTVFPANMVDTDADGVLDFPVYDGRAYRQALGVLLTGKTTVRPLGGRSGVTPGVPRNSVTATAATWTVKPMSGSIDKMTAAEAGAYFWSIDANVTGPVTAADSDNPRIDLLSILVQDPPEDGLSTRPTLSITYTIGDAGSGAAPAAPDGAMGLANINVPRAGTGAPTVTWVAPYTAAAGGIIPIFGPDEYPGDPYDGQFIVDTVARQPKRYDKTSGMWVPYVEAGMFRVNRTTALANCDSDGVRPTIWDAAPYVVGSAVTWPGGSGPLVAQRDGSFMWKATTTFPASTDHDHVGQYVEVNGVAFSSGRQTADLNGSHQTTVNSTGDLTLHTGDSVQLVLFDADATISVNPVTMSLKYDG